ncbi:hypothetical protein [Pseudomonas neuropathica]|uniref:hypothetical protein n=1 Tax=Pseudomonas neuropathica TaxID=2730425 RepID=UPI003EBAB63C
MSKKIFLSNASCMNGILQALCHVLESAVSKAFKASEQISAVGWATLWLATVAVETVKIDSDDLMH